MELEQLREKMKAAGVIGAGGAGFPTHQKLAQGIDTVLVNACECEPLLYTDCVILQRELDSVLTGVREMRDALGAKQAYLCMKKHTADYLKFSDGDGLAHGIRVKVLPDVYPMGDEVVLIYQALGRVVPPGNLPSAVGVVVINAETACNIGGAVRDIPVTQKWLTIGGAVKQPTVVRVPVNTNVKDLLAAAGVSVPEGHVVIDGGPAMGNLINPLTAKVTKKTKAVLILPDSIPAITAKTAPVERLLRRTPSACCQCSFCTDLCPRHLLGYPLAPHKTLRAVGTNTFTKPEDLLTASLCSGCGLCTLMACCQGITPSVTMVEVKKNLGKNRIGYRADAPTIPHVERDWRMVPADRLLSRIGVAPYNRRAEWSGDLATDQTVYHLPLSQHVGKPSVPRVKAGDEVRVGQMVAHADEGISAALHAPVSGIVTAISAGEIEITMGEVK